MHRAQAPAAPVHDAWPDHVLRVCSDPNNLPFSDERGEGFENRIASLITKELGDSVSYTGWAQRRGFIRNALDNLIRWIQAPESIEPGTAMANLGVTQEIARDMAAHLYTLR